MKEQEMLGLSPEAARAEIEYLYEAGKEAAETEARLAAPTAFEAFGLQYICLNGDLERVQPEKMIMPKSFSTYSLDGLIRYIQADVDGFFSDPARKCLVRVTDWRTVEVLTPATGYYQERAVLACCSADVPQLRLGQYMEPEEFQISCKPISCPAKTFPWC